MRIIILDKDDKVDMFAVVIVAFAIFAAGVICGMAYIELIDHFSRTIH